MLNKRNFCEAAEEEVLSSQDGEAILINIHPANEMLDKEWAGAVGGE